MNRRGTPELYSAMRIEEMMECDGSHVESTSDCGGEKIEVQVALPTGRWTTLPSCSPILDVLQSHLVDANALPVIAILGHTESEVFREVCTDASFVSTVLVHSGPTALPLRGCFDIVIDTGVIDSLLDRPNSRSKVLRAIDQISRILRESSARYSKHSTFIL